MGQLNVWPEFGFRNGRSTSHHANLFVSHFALSVGQNSQVVYERNFVHNFDVDPETECASLTVFI